MRARAALRALPILGIGLGVYLQVIRPWQLRWGATDDEVRRATPGDEIVTRPTFNATRAVTVQAPPSVIWPWIVQIGFGRAGWYSYDLLDNFGRPSTTYIIPELQHLQPGDLIPVYRGIGAPEGVGLTVKALQPEQWVLWWDDKTHDTTWTWALYPVDEQRTRLIARPHALPVDQADHPVQPAGRVRRPGDDAQVPARHQTARREPGRNHAGLQSSGPAVREVDLTLDASAEIYLLVGFDCRCYHR